MQHFKTTGIVNNFIFTGTTTGTTTELSFNITKHKNSEPSPFENLGIGLSGIEISIVFLLMTNRAYRYNLYFYSIVI